MSAPCSAESTTSACCAFSGKFTPADLVLVRSDRLNQRRRRDFEMQLIAQVALEVTQRMRSIVRGGADVCGEIRDANRMGSNGVEHLRPVFDIGKLGKIFASRVSASANKSPFVGSAICASVRSSAL